MGEKFDDAKEVIADKLNFPKEILLNIPKITIIGDKEICIENHRGIILFEEEEIRVASDIGRIIIRGKKFEILFLGGYTLTISGILGNILLESNE